MLLVFLLLLHGAEEFYFFSIWGTVTVVSFEMYKSLG